MDQTQFMKGIKNITNKITKTKDSVGKVIAYSHLSKVTSSLLDGPKIEGKPIIFNQKKKKKEGLKTEGNQCLLKKKRNPKTQKGEPIVLKIRKRKRIEKS